MTIALLRLEVRGPRRVRAIFTGPLAAGAFTSTTYYTFQSVTNSGPAPSPVAAFAVAGLADAVELALSVELVAGGSYTLTCAAVPAADASAYTGVDPFRYGSTANETIDRDAVTYDADRQAFGVDLTWAGDWIEGADGDLAETAGIDCAMADLGHAIEDDGLPWDPTWGAGLGSYVDAPGPSQGSARGAIVAQVRKDDRVQSATVKATQADVSATSTDDRVTFAIVPTFRGDRKGDQISYALVP